MLVEIVFTSSKPTIYGKTQASGITEEGLKLILGCNGNHSQNTNEIMGSNPPKSGLSQWVDAGAGYGNWHQDS